MQECRNGAGFLYPVAGVPQQARVVEHERAVALAIGTVALQSILFVGVQPDADVDRMFGLAEGGVPRQPQLQAPREVFAGIRAHLDATGRRVSSTVQNCP